MARTTRLPVGGVCGSRSPGVCWPLVPILDGVLHGAEALDAQLVRWLERLGHRRSEQASGLLGSRAA